MHAKGEVRLNFDEDRRPATVVIPLPHAAQVQKSWPAGIQAGDLGLVVVTLVLMGLLFAVAYRVVQQPWVMVSAPIPTTMISQEIVLNPAEKTVR
jgi:hypothetical protein